jgi:uncharacterized protein (TIGR02271 family)
MITSQQMDDLVGATVRGADGEKIGKVGEVYIDAAGAPQWLSVATGLFGTKHSFLPAASCRLGEDGDIEVPFDKSTVKDAPKMDTDDEHLSVEQEEQLDLHYGLDFAGTPDGGARPADVGEVEDIEQTMTRSEERLDVDTERVVTGRVRLRKYVVTENVATTVPVSHEEVRIEYEPIAKTDHDSAQDSPQIAEAEYEVVLHAERPVVNKVLEPIERVRLHTETVTEQQIVSGQVRKEHIQAQTLED